MDISEYSADEYHVIRSKVCNAILITTSTIVVPSLTASLYRIVDFGWLPVMALQIIMAIMLWIITIYRRHIPYVYRAGYIVSAFIIVGVGGIWQFGLVSASSVFIILSGPAAAILFEGLTGLVILCLSLIILTIFGFLFVSGYLVSSIDGNLYAVATSSWISLLFGSLLFSGMLTSAIYLINRNLVTALRNSQYNAKKLHQHKLNLEKTIEERTLELQRSNDEIERFAQIAAHDIRSSMNIISGYA